jgi:hypothetical protein
MTAREPAHPLEKRDLLHAADPNRSRVSGIAARLAGAGRWPEAIDYIEVIKDDGLLAKAEAEAVTAGSAWLLQQVERISGKKCDASQWEKLSEAAARHERWRDAVRALSLGGQGERAEALRLEKCPEYDPFKPLGK